MHFEFGYYYEKQQLWVASEIIRKILFQRQQKRHILLKNQFDIDWRLNQK